MRLWLAMRAGLLACAALAAAALGLATPASAQIGSGRYAAIVLDHRSGAVLAEANADETRHPASLTKMMTLYMVFEALRDGRLTLQSRVPISPEAASRPPSKLGIPPGNSISVEQAILALVTRSANDVATAVGETLGGSEARFAQLMTLRARGLGMARTTFRNASGLPDPDQVSTARDMATLGRRLFQDFPDRYHYFGVTHAEFGSMRIRNHNRMLDSYEGVDGIKTGFINASGFNIVTSASRGGHRLVGAVFGGSSWVERDQHMASLLDRGFDQLGVATREARGGSGMVRAAAAAPLPRAAAQPAARQVTSRRASTQPARQPAVQATRGASTGRQAPRRAVATQAPNRAAASQAPRRTAAAQAPRRTAASQAPRRQVATTPPRQATVAQGSRAPQPTAAPAPRRTASQARQTTPR